MKTAKRMIKRGFLVMFLTWMVVTAIGMVGSGAGSKTAQAAGFTIKIPKNANKKDAKVLRKLNQTDPYFLSYQWKKGRLVKLDISSSTKKSTQTILTQLKSLTALTDLNLQLGIEKKYKLDLSKNKKLESAVIHTRISKLNLSKNKKLKSLTLSDTNIPKLDVSKNVLLKDLRIAGGGKLKKVDLSPNKKLKFLSISKDNDSSKGSMEIERLDVSNLRNLRWVDLDCVSCRGDLEELPFLLLISLL